MPKVTHQDTVEFIQKHLALLDTTEEQKLSEEDQAVHYCLKLMRAEEKWQAANKKLTDECVAAVGPHHIKTRISDLANKMIFSSLPTHEKSNSLWPMGALAVTGGFFGKKLGGAGRTGFALGLIGMLGGAALGSLFAKKQTAEKGDENLVFLTLEMTSRLSALYPDSKTFIIEAMADQLHQKGHDWADVHGGWAKAVRSGVDMDVLRDHVANLSARISPLSSPSC